MIFTCFLSFVAGAARRFVLLLPLPLVLCAGCNESRTPDWQLDGAPAANTTTTTPAPSGAGGAPVADDGGAALRFISHNVENWLMMQRSVDGRIEPEAPKPEHEKQALVAMIARHQPDVFGVSEIGTPEDLADLQERLRAAGCDLPYLHHHQGADPVRALGLLSRYPIAPADRQADTRFRMIGREYGMLRGILDATTTLPCGRGFRFIGVHFKSKREVPDYDQEVFRNHEAHRLRRHLDRILADDPGARLVVFGDFNDTRASRAVSTVVGHQGHPGRLVAVQARDSGGHAWTHHWRIHDLYSRIDYIFVSPTLRREADLENARVLDDPEWREASDHRPLLLDFPAR